MNSLQKGFFNPPRPPQNTPIPTYQGEIDALVQERLADTPHPYSPNRSLADRASTTSTSGKVCRTTPMTPSRKSYGNTSSAASPTGIEFSPNSKHFLETPTSALCPRMPSSSVEKSFSGLERELIILSLETKKVTSEPSSPTAPPSTPKRSTSKL